MCLYCMSHNVYYNDEHSLLEELVHMHHAFSSQTIHFDSFLYLSQASVTATFDQKARAGCVLYVLSSGKPGRPGKEVQ